MNDKTVAGLVCLIALVAGSKVSAQTACSAADVAGRYESRYSTIQCTANGDRLDCCYDSSCRYELNLQISADGQRAVGRWDHLDGRSGTASFPVDAECSLTSGLWGNGDSEPTRGWSVSSRLDGDESSVSTSGTQCTLSDIEGSYPSGYGEVRCTTAGSALACCYSSNCRYSLELAIADGGRLLTGTWDHNDGRTGTAEFTIEAGCAIGDGRWGEGDADPTTAWSVGARIGGIESAGPCAFPNPCAEQLPGDQFEPELLPGDQFEPELLPGDQFEPELLPGDQFEPELLPGDQFDEQQPLSGTVSTQQSGDAITSTEIPDSALPSGGGGSTSLAETVGSGGATPLDFPDGTGESSGPEVVDMSAAENTEILGDPLDIGYTSDEEAEAAAAERAAAAGNETTPMAILPHPSGDPGFSAISGWDGDRVSRLDLESAFLTGIRWSESNDKPCELTIFGKSADHSGGDYVDVEETTRFGDCVGSSVGILSVGGETGEVHLQQGIEGSVAAIGRLQVCNNDRGRLRLKGLRIWGDQINPDGTTTYLPNSDLDQFYHCNDWDASVLCPAGLLGTGLVVHTSDAGGSSEQMHGLQLICRQVSVE